MSRVLDEHGAALLLALALLLMLAAAGAAAALTVRTEALLAASFRHSSAAQVIAEGALARAIQDLSAEPDWSGPLSGALSTFVDGSATGAKQLPGGDTVVLCCGAGSLTDQVRQRANAGRSWGSNTPEWRLFAWGKPSAWRLGDTRADHFYLAVWVADDPADGDGNASIDRNGIIAVHALALGPRRALRSVEAVVQHARGADGPLGRGVAVIWSRETRW